MRGSACCRVELVAKLVEEFDLVTVLVEQFELVTELDK